MRRAQILDLDTMCVSQFWFFFWRKTILDLFHLYTPLAKFYIID